MCALATLALLAPQDSSAVTIQWDQDSTDQLDVTLSWDASELGGRSGFSLSGIDSPSKIWRLHSFTGTVNRPGVSMFMGGPAFVADFDGDGSDEARIRAGSHVLNANTSATDGGGLQAINIPGDAPLWDYQVNADLSGSVRFHWSSNLAPAPAPSVPDAGSTALLLGFSALALGAGRRFRREV